MDQETPERIEVLLTSEGEAGRVSVDLDAFVRFSIAMEASLETLMNNWKHYPPVPAKDFGGSRRSTEPSSKPELEE
ncbi:hypothetical protein Psta_4012 [Pirellula staleyi DSM 6068]|uniref:Uncharacterized protein n=1 Tax=Pirellula staleyi (strain ATCC 27377 / DSM 6068 / ICPB 4128) TaxID=530564 RepID=D2R255_PIRSD|nr:hypothetical protein [Pirellula staleyi]ADB18666.1 hypothetical protein Psta_4012 [Pirellula staleyi DSM 6068]